jgi:predicted XRE-type DNA-binding protein
MSGPHVTKHEHLTSGDSGVQVASAYLQPERQTEMTEEIAKQIKQIALVNPNLYQHQIAAMLGINQGRVSEVLNGKKYSHVQP